MCLFPWFCVNWRAIVLKREQTLERTLRGEALVNMRRRIHASLRPKFTPIREKPKSTNNGENELNGKSTFCKFDTVQAILKPVGVGEAKTEHKTKQNISKFGLRSTALNSLNIAVKRDEFGIKRLLLFRKVVLIQPNSFH